MKSIQNWPRYELANLCQDFFFSYVDLEYVDECPDEVEFGSSTSAISDKAFSRDRALLEELA